MATQYRCKNEKRAQTLRDAALLTLNGIDYLEVLHGDAPSGTIPQRTLIVRMIKPAPKNLTADDAKITGGVRIKTIKVEWVIRASDASDALVSSGLITTAEKDYFLTLTEPSYCLVVRTNVAGDFSPYKLCLEQNRVLDPEQTFDPILSEVEFFFKVECPSDFDCQTEEECPPSKGTEPQIDYLSRDYESLRQLMLDRLAIIMPDWQEASAADVGMAIVEAMAYVGDYLSYYQDAVSTEAYLGTARKRVSLRRHARLLDYIMHDGCNARTWVHFDVDSNKKIVLSNGTQLVTRVEKQSACIKPVEFSEVLEQQPTVFETMHNAALFKAHNRILFYTWGEPECCLPKGATKATLKGKLTNLKVDDVLVFMEERNPENGSTADADINHRHAVRLTKVQTSTDPLFKDTPVTDIEWMEADALPFPLCVALVEIPESEQGSGVAKSQPSSVALGNNVLADHGYTVTTAEDVYLEKFADHYRCRLEDTDITHSVAFCFEDDEERKTATVVYGKKAASELLSQDVEKALPAVVLEDKEGTWQPQHDLLNSNRFALEFVVEMEDDGRAWIRFGDDVHGRLPDSDSEFTPTYRVGSGSNGNIGAAGIQHVVTLETSITAVWNPLPAEGGTDAESIEEIRQYAPQAFRTQERAVTEEDYAEVAQRYPEVQKAVATRRWTGSWHTMFLTIDRKSGFDVTEAFEAKLVEFLDKYRLAGQDLEIDGPRYVPLDITFTVCVESGYFRSDVKEALLEVFSSRELSDGSLGFFHPDNFTFGQPVYLSEFLAKAMQVPGVRWVNTEAKDSKTGELTGNCFKRWGQEPDSELEQGYIDIGRLEIARLDNDPNAPENGKLDFIMEGGL